MESKSRWSKWTNKVIMFVMMVAGGLVGQIVWEQIMQKKYKDNSVDLIVQVSDVIRGQSKLLYAQHIISMRNTHGSLSKLFSL